MKNSSIKKRVALYYSLVLVLITVLVFGVFILTARIQTNVVSKDTVMQAVQNSFDEVTLSGQTLQIDNDFDSFSKGVTLLIYDEKGRLIKGTVPTDFPVSTPLATGEHKEIKEGDETWLVYDQYNTYENGQDLWIRGIYILDNGVATLNSIIKIMLIVLPILLFFAIWAGRRITSSAFAPVAKITEASNSISSGRDLSKRLPLGENKDELYYLTETLNEMINRLEEAFISEKEFSSDVSHELKTPISVILTECEYVLQENRQASEYKESIETIQLQCKRTMSLIQQLLQVSRSLDKEKAIEREDFNLSDLCTNIVSELTLAAKDHGVILDSEIQGDVEFNGDETLIMRMIINLITNGIKYSNDSNRSWVKLTLIYTDKIKIIVSDNGIGIGSRDQENIFNRFYKADKSRSDEAHSFGLGLSMVKWIAEAHGGEVSVTSALGEGSQFIVSFS